MRMPYGKFKGYHISDIPSYYVKRLAENTVNVIATASDKEWTERENLNSHIEQAEFDLAVAKGEIKCLV